MQEENTVPRTVQTNVEGASLSDKHLMPSLPTGNKVHIQAEIVQHTDATTGDTNE